MRLIDADELIEKLDPEYKATVKLIKKGEAHLDNLAEGYKEVHDLIIWSPTVDAEPVRHGHWIEDDDGDGRHCSICGEDYCYAISNCELYNYCPNCGAKMDEVEE